MKPNPTEITAEEFARLKKEADNAKAEHERAKGALAQLMQQLKTEFNCPTLAQARKLLDQLKQDKADAQAKFNKALAQYEADWKNENPV